MAGLFSFRAAKGSREKQEKTWTKTLCIFNARSRFFVNEQVFIPTPETFLSPTLVCRHRASKMHDATPLKLDPEGILIAPGGAS